MTPLDETMVFWLSLCRRGAPNDKIALNETTLRRRQLYKVAGIPPVQDIMRHSAGSYPISFWQALDPTEGVVLEKALRVLGHGSKSFFRHYRQLVRPAIGKAKAGATLPNTKEVITVEDIEWRTFSNASNGADVSGRATKNWALRSLHSSAWRRS